MRYYGLPLGDDTVTESAAGPRFSIADVAKSAFQVAKQEALRRIGVHIAQTPEGQRAIQTELERRAVTAVRQPAFAIPAGLAIVGALVAIPFLLGRRGRR